MRPESSVRGGWERITLTKAEGGVGEKAGEGMTEERLLLEEMW